MAFVDALAFPNTVAPDLTTLDVLCNRTDLLDSYLVKSADSEATIKWLVEPICQSSLEYLNQEIGDLIANDPNFYQSLVKYHPSFNVYQ